MLVISWRILILSLMRLIRLNCQQRNGFAQVSISILPWVGKNEYKEMLATLRWNNRPLEETVPACDQAALPDLQGCAQKAVLCS